MTDETFKPIPISQNRMVWADGANATGEARFKYDGEGFQPSFTGVIGPEGTMALASIAGMPKIHIHCMRPPADEDGVFMVQSERGSWFNLVFAPNQE